MTTRPTKRRREFDARAHQPRFRPDEVERTDRPRLSATLAEYALARQMNERERAERQG